MKEKFIKIVEKPFVIYSIIALVGVVVFCSIYGTYVLDPTYTDWLLTGGDLEQHYLGWRAYRNSAWTIPIGGIDGLVYPDQTSVIFTDSIPIFAFVFKLLSPILPAEFQYFGLWGVLCFVLQGIFSAKIIKNFTDNKVCIVLAGCLFMFVPCMIWRMYAHTALAGQWIILLALEVLIAYEKYYNTKKLYIVIAITGVLVASIHIYFALMCGIIFAAVCIVDILNYKRIKNSIFILVTYILSALITAGVLGLFSLSGMSMAAGGLGVFSFNLNSFVNPQGWSQFLRNLEYYGTGQYEGFTYLGAGVILLLLLAILVMAWKRNFKESVKNHWGKMIGILVALIAAVIVALSPVITIGNSVIMKLDLPDTITNIWGIFRASGRIAWVAVYIVMLGACIILCKKLGKRMAVIVMAIGFILQVYDIHAELARKNDQFNQVVEADFKLEDEAVWNAIANTETVEHIVMTNVLPNAEIYTITDWALDQKMTVNWFNLAHTDGGSFEERVQNVLTEITDEEVFIFDASNKMECLKYDLYYYQAGKYIVGYGEEIDGLTQMKPEEFSVTYMFGDGSWITNGVDVEGERILYPEGLSYGPYWDIPAGDYYLTIRGDKITENARIVIYSESGKYYYDFSVVESTDDKMLLLLNLESDVKKLEFSIMNISDHDLVLRSIDLQCK